jgi:hypothetical protein
MRKTIIPKEDEEQIMVVNWFRLAFPRTLIYHTPSGQLRKFLIAVKLKNMGVVPGIPDLFVPAWKLYIEMKRVKGGTLTEAQEEMIPYLESCGYVCIVAKGFDDARSQILNFKKSNLMGQEGLLHI